MKSNSGSLRLTEPRCECEQSARSFRPGFHFNREILMSQLTILLLLSRKLPLLLNAL